MASTLKHVDLFQPDHRVPVQQNVSGKLTIWLKCSNSEMVLGSLSLSYKKITFIPKLPKIRCFSIELTGMKWLYYNASVTIYDHKVLIVHWVWFVLLGWSHLKQQTSRKDYKNDIQQMVVQQIFGNVKLLWCQIILFAKLAKGYLISKNNNNLPIRLF